MEENKELQERNQQEQDEFEKNQVIMTPGQLVAKRFFRNKLSCVGLAIIIVMALFCIIGPFISPYGEYEIFYIDRRPERKSVWQMQPAIKSGCKCQGADLFFPLAWNRCGWT